LFRAAGRPAILVDAFVVRTVLVPALMHWFGRANWWLPTWLDRLLPILPVESGPAAAPDRAALDDRSRRTLSGRPS
jgi:uncharacterized membrane protein YdfJ with MMPL/SSD domain